MADNRGKDNQSARTLWLVLVVIVVALVLFYFWRQARQSNSQQPTVAAAQDSNPKHWDIKYLMPKGSADDEIIYHTAYIVGFNDHTEEPDWVFYELTDKETHGDEERSNNFRADPDVKAGSAKPDDYVHSGYDKGHLVPAGDMKWDATIMSETFFMSNMCPQKPALNRGIWKHLEEQVRHWADREHNLYISAGPIFFNSDPATIGRDRVAVPDAFFKVVATITSGQYKGIAFIMKNEGSNEPLQNFAVSIDSIQNLTGIDFFPALPDSLENAIEKTYDLHEWFSNDTYHQ